METFTATLKEAYFFALYKLGFSTKPGADRLEMEEAPQYCTDGYCARLFGHPWIDPKGHKVIRGVIRVKAEALRGLRINQKQLAALKRYGVLDIPKEDVLGRGKVRVWSIDELLAGGEG